MPNKYIISTSFSIAWRRPSPDRPGKLSGINEASSFSRACKSGALDCRFDIYAKVMIGLT